MTPADYPAVERKSNTKHELVNGVVYAMAGVSHEHWLITNNLVLAIGTRSRGTSLQHYVVVDQDEIMVRVHSRSGELWTTTNLGTREQLLALSALRLNIPLGEIYEDVPVRENPKFRRLPQ